MNPILWISNCIYLFFLIILSLEFRSAVWSNLFLNTNILKISELCVKLRACTFYVSWNFPDTRATKALVGLTDTVQPLHGFLLIPVPGARTLSLAQPGTLPKLFYNYVCLQPFLCHYLLFLLGRIPSVDPKAASGATDGPCNQSTAQPFCSAPVGLDSGGEGDLQLRQP